MDRLEQELLQALTRKDPSPGFAERVIAAAATNRVAVSPASDVGQALSPVHQDFASRVQAARSTARPWLAVAATVVLMLGGGIGWRRHQGAIAKQQVMTAMRITAVQLNHIQTRVREVRP